MQIGGYDQPISIDGVTVNVGKEGSPAYVPRREVEVVAECTNLTGWEGTAGNAYEKGATAQMAAHVSDPGTQPRDVTVRWQLAGSQGEQLVSAPLGKKATLAPGNEHSATKPDFRERGGGSFAGREQILQRYQRIGDGVPGFGTRAPHSAKENARFLRTAGLTFEVSFAAPKSGTCNITGTASNTR